MSVGSSNKQRLIYFFSSAPQDRPNYKRGVLNALAYSPGHEMELNYQKSYIDPNLFLSRAAIKDRRGVFVFLDYKRDADHDFYPIRFVTVQELAPKEEAKQYRDKTRVSVRVE